MEQQAAVIRLSSFFDFLCIDDLEDAYCEAKEIYDKDGQTLIKDWSNEAVKLFKDNSLETGLGKTTMFCSGWWLNTEVLV